MTASVPSSSTLRVCFVTLGCAKNEVDSSHMENRLRSAGFSIVDEPSLSDAIIVNTCSFIQAATEESLEMIFDMIDLDTDEKDKPKVIVAGCMPARYGEELAQELPEVQAFIPCSKEDDIVEILTQLFEIDLDSSAQPRYSSLDMRSDHPQSPTAYVKISDGCDRFCSFCTIPFIRGRYHSFTFDDIAHEIDELTQLGVREVVLIAQDTGRWGDDLDPPSSLAELLDKLAYRFSDTWFRVMYIQPEGVTDELLDVVASHSNICSYFDIPLQHIDAKILKQMNRRGSLHEATELLSRIRSKVPDVTLRTTLIAGFPGESDQAFEDLCAFLEDAALDYVGVFPYSQEEGTRAARLPQQVPEEEKIERAQILRDIADSISVSLVSQRIGKTFEVLVLGREEDGQLYGRAQCQAPDVDGVVYLQRGTIGEIESVTISDTLMYEMEGE